MSSSRRLKSTKQATRERLRKRAQRERKHLEAEATAAPFRSDDQEQAEFLKAGVPPKASPVLQAAWVRAMAMTPAERRAAQQAQAERFCRYFGLDPADTFVSQLPPDGSADPADESTYDCVAFWSEKQGRLIAPKE